MVDNVTRNPGTYIRNIEDIFGDMSSLSLIRSYPKVTCYHIFIEELISSVVWESANSRYENEVLGKGLWIDHLLKENRKFLPQADLREAANFNGSVFEYLEFLSESGLTDKLCEVVAEQVFYVLFSNRFTLRSFGLMVAGYVLNSAPGFDESAFNSKGKLRRAHIPQWARDAVFHRDKGRCVQCKADLTRIFSKTNKVNFDHIVPLALGGMNCVTNLQLFCEACNSEKGAKHANTSYEYEPWY